jgi:hypothetical protein
MRPAQGFDAPFIGRRIGLDALGQDPFEDPSVSFVRFSVGHGSETLHHSYLITFALAQEVHW